MSLVNYVLNSAGWAIVGYVCAVWRYDRRHRKDHDDD